MVNSWQHQDLSGTTGAPAATSNPFGYVFVSQGTLHVVYAGFDGHIHGLQRGAGFSKWQYTDLTVAAQAPETGLSEDPTGYTFAEGSMHVIYRSKDFDVHELWWEPDYNGWQYSNLTTSYKAPTADFPSSAYAFDAQFTQQRCLAQIQTMAYTSLNCGGKLIILDGNIMTLPRQVKLPELTPPTLAQKDMASTHNLRSM